jgi:UDP-N-acetylglucosamine:LPS N-acetylglucosamine transferase
VSRGGETPPKDGESRVKLMVTLAGGGFLLEAQSLLRRLGDGYEYCYITADDCMVPEEYSHAEVSYLRSFARLGEPHLWQRLPAFLHAIVQAHRALLRSKPDFVVCVGTALSVPICVAARVMRIPSAYIDSITRFERPSQTAKIISHLRLADRVYVQWPDSVHLYPGGIYRGTVL